MASPRGDKHLPLLGRLADQGQVEDSVLGGLRSNKEHDRFARVARQPREVTTDPQPELGLSGDSDGFSGFSGISFARKNRSRFVENLELLREKEQLSEGLPEPFRDPVLIGKVLLARETSPSPSSVFPQRGVELEDGSTLGHLPTSTRCKRSSEVVDPSTSKERRRIACSAEPRPSVIYRRFGVGMGSDARSKGGVRHLDKGTGVLAHQLQGTCGHTPSLKVLRRDSQRRGDTDKLGQHHGSGLHTQARRHALFLPLSVDKKPVNLDGRKRHISPHKVCSRDQECESGQTEQEKSGPSHRMDSTRRSVSKSLVPVGETSHRPVCDVPLQKNRDLLLSSGRSESLRNRRVSHGLVGCGRIRLSPVQNPGGSAQEVRSFEEHEVDTHSPILASPGMVHGGTGVDSGLPQIASNRHDLLRQPHFERFHHNLPGLALTAFRLSKDLSEREAFLARLRALSLEPAELRREEYTSQSGKSLGGGVRVRSCPPPVPL
ncbi:uncharacterized protein LOC135197885 [Macrobrachium nipponense]|uniref:uncharacterized protein LOC135197885 n=1 Tax=Macrobrachium nipponense TaxID=159736 RepID=UPI0030C89420